MAWRLTFSISWQLLLLIRSVPALDISHCSTNNTGSSLGEVRDIFQSNGFCSDACVDRYAFAVIQEKGCWCSNYAPGDSVNPADCDESCPGYPDEQCGSLASGLFAYFPLALPPSGTYAPAAVQQSTPTERLDIKPSSASRPAETVTKQASAPNPVPSEPSTTSDRSPRLALDSTSVPTTLSESIRSGIAAEAESVMASIVTVTKDGTTIMSTAMITPTDDIAVGESSATPSGTNSGKVAGIAVGAAGGIVAVLGLVFWVFYRKRKHGQSSPGTPQSYTGDSGKSFPRRHASQMSQAGLIDKNPRIVTTGLPGGPGANSAGTSFSPTNRYSAGTDIRLNPSALYAHEENQHSSVSLQDNRDYSRQLQIRNPDPRQ